MLSQTSIFIKNITILDAAVLLPDLGPRGRSWHVDVKLSGARDEEGILLDFSYAKKTVKAIIDREFDHRFFIPRKDCQIDETRVYVHSKLESADATFEFALDSYREGVVIFEEKLAQDPALLRKQIEKEISARVLNQIDNNVKNVVITLREHEQFSDAHYFSYTHSLRHHDGNCQRFHGHSNIVEVLSEGELSHPLSSEIANRLDGCYLVSKEYISQNEKKEFINLAKRFSLEKMTFESLEPIRYTGSQGDVFVLYPKSKLVVMPEESTIENIADFIKNEFLSHHKNIQVIAYEGIQKGAIAE